MTRIATLAVVGTVLAVTAQAGPRRGRDWRGERPGPAVLDQQLGLSAEQAAKLQALRQEGRKEAIRRRADLQLARIELDEALNAASIDEKLVAEKLQSLNRLQAAALQARVDQRLACAKVLTPEQRAKMRQLRGEWRGRDRGRPWGRKGRVGTGPAGGPMGPMAAGQAER